MKRLNIFKLSLQFYILYTDILYTIYTRARIYNCNTSDECLREFNIPSN